MAVEWWAWAAVIAFILAMLAVDLLFFHRDAHEVSIREAATWSAIWIALSLAFGAIVWAGSAGRPRASTSPAISSRRACRSTTSSSSPSCSATSRCRWRTSTGCSIGV